MRFVTTKPPKILIDARKTPKQPTIDTQVLEVSIPATKIAPTNTMPLIALVTAIKGVCNAGVTPQIT